MKIRVAAVAMSLALIGPLFAAQAAKADSTSFITTDAPDYYRASKLSGVDVYNDKDDKIGAISEVLVNRAGKAEAVVIGVGGFLGIGEHSVAVPFSSIKWVNDKKEKADYPAKAVLPNASKEELKAAPEFKYKG